MRRMLARADEVIEWVRQPQAGAIQPVQVRPRFCCTAGVRSWHDPEALGCANRFR
jgi:hypothetical protein